MSSPVMAASSIASIRLPTPLLYFSTWFIIWFTDMRKYLLQFLYGVVMKNLLRMVVGVQFGKSDFLKSYKQFIIIANHNSHLDTMSLLASLPGDKVHTVKPVAAMDYFGKTKFKEKMR